MKPSWNHDFILFCEKLNSIDSLKEILAVFNILKELNRCFWFCCLIFNYFAKLHHKLFLWNDTILDNVILEGIFINPDFTFLILIEFDHVSFRSEKSKTMAKPLKANHRLLKCINSLAEGNLSHLTKRLQLAFKLYEDLE